MNQAQKELCGWTVMVVIFFGCLFVGVNLADNENETLDQIGTCCTAVSFLLAFPLAVRFRWFRIMLGCAFLFLAMCVGTGRQKRKY